MPSSPRRRSWVLAAMAAVLGSLLFAYDDLLEHAELSGGNLHHMVEVLEFLLLGPGMGILVFNLSEYFRVLQLRLQDADRRAHQERLIFLGRIAAGIAHEVRNPLHNIRLLLDEANHQQGQPNTAVDSRLLGNLERINRAVELVYHLAKPQDDAPEDLVAGDLPQLIREAIARTNYDLPLDGDQVQALVSCPANVLRLVLDNILRNAITAAGAQVSVTIKRSAQDWLCIIRNPGSLPAELRDNPEAEIHLSHHGLGLGLFLSRQLLRSYSGRLTLRQVGHDVVAELRLPAWDMSP